MAYNPNNPNGQATSANSAPVVLASDQTLPIGKDTAATGSLTALNTTVVLTTAGVGTGIFEIAGTWVGTITFEGSNNAFTTSQSITAIFLGGIQTQAATTATNGFFSVVTAGFAQVRARMSAYTSGTATVVANGSQADRIVVPLQGNPNNNQTLATLAAGTAVIGHVIADTGSTTAVTALPALPTGANTIGNMKLVDTGGTNQLSISAANAAKTYQLGGSTPAPTNVASSATNVTALASNVSRRQAMFYNDSTQICYLKLGTTASSTSYTVQLVAGAYYELPYPTYTGNIDAIWASANGNLRVTEVV